MGPGRTGRTSWRSTSGPTTTPRWPRCRAIWDPPSAALLPDEVDEGGSGVALVVDDWDEVAAGSVLTEPERQRFERDGYLLLRGVLPDDQVSELRRVAADFAAAFHAREGVDPHALLNLHDLIGRHRSFDPLVDHPRVLPKVWGILGWNIQLFHTQLVVTPPAPTGATPGAYGWHQDNNRMNLDIEIDPPHPRVSVKVGYLLSDAVPGAGNLVVVPGSQRRGRPRIPLGEQPEGAVEVLGRCGDAVLFDRRLWHSASTNISQQDRIMLFVGYSHRWLRPKSAMDLPELVAASSPIRAQLLGASPSGANGYYEPSAEDVPLRAWIETHLGPDALTP